MEDYQLAALRDAVNAAYDYFLAPEHHRMSLRADFCEALGRLVTALEEEIGGDDDPSTKPSARRTPEDGKVVPFRRRGSGAP